jgi:hypothetical protein
LTQWSNLELDRALPLTRHLDAALTPSYVSPEQLRASSLTSRRISIRSASSCMSCLPASDRHAAANLWRSSHGTSSDTCGELIAGAKLFVSPKNCCDLS